MAIALRDIKPPDLAQFTSDHGVDWVRYGWHMSLTRVHGWETEVSPRDCTTYYGHKDRPGRHTIDDAWAIQSALNALNEE